MNMYTLTIAALTLGIIFMAVKLFKGKVDLNAVSEVSIEQLENIDTLVAQLEDIDILAGRVDTLSGLNAKTSLENLALIRQRDLLQKSVDFAAIRAYQDSFENIVYYNEQTGNLVSGSDLTKIGNV